METLGFLLHGFGQALTLQNLGFALLGSVLGTLVGVLPGIGPTWGIAILLPLTTFLPPAPAIIMLAAVVEGGLRLGPVGGRIVVEVFIGLLQLDPGSYMSVNPRWRPTLAARYGRVTGDFRMVDFLTFAGVDPDHRGQ